LHDHSFFNIISHWFSNLHQAHLKSCAWPNVGAWLFVYVVIPFFHCFMHLFGFPHPLNLLVCHIALMFNLWTSWESIFFVAPWWGEDKFLWYYVRCLCIKDARFHVYMNRPTFFYCLSFSLHIDGLALWFWWMVFWLSLTLSSLISLEHIWFHGQLYLMGLLQ
jgi:hypothetical protein